MKYRSQDHPKKGEWEITDVRIVEAWTRRWIAVAVVAVGLGLLIGGAVYAVCVRDTAKVWWIVGIGASMVITVLVSYFRHGK